MNLSTREKDVLIKALNLAQFENDNFVYLYDNDPCTQEAVRVVREESEIIKSLRRKFWSVSE